MKTVFALLALSILLMPFSYGQKGKKSVEYSFEKLKSAEGRVLKGEKHSKWKYWTDQGQLDKIVNYNKGAREGQFVKFKNQDDWDISPAIRADFHKINYEFLLDEQKAEPLTDTIARGYFRNDRKEGVWRYYDNLRYTEKNYSEGKLDGETRVYSWLGTLLKSVQYENDMKNGVSTNYSSKGRVIKKETYKDDVLNGEFYEKTRLNGLSMSGSYLNGEVEGILITYTRDGEILAKSAMTRGKLNGVSIGYEKNYKTMHTYQNDELSGDYSIIDSNTKLDQILGPIRSGHQVIQPDYSYYKAFKSTKIYGEYLDEDFRTVNVFTADSVPLSSYTIKGEYGEQFEGKYELYRDGNISFKGFFLNGRPDSVWTYYNEKGDIVEQKSYSQIDKKVYYGYYDDGLIMGSSLDYHVKFDSSGNKLFEFDRLKKFKNLYYANKQKKASFYILEDNDKWSATEKLYTSNGKLCVKRVYNEEKLIISKKVYCKGFSDQYSIFTDENFAQFFISAVEPIYEEAIAEEPIFDYAEVWADFPGGNGEFEKYLLRKSPSTKHSKEGEIVIEFTVQRDGRVSKVNITKDQVGGGRSIELARILDGSPKWRPGESQGRKKSCLMEVHFQINKKSSKANVSFVSFE